MDAGKAAVIASVITAVATITAAIIGLYQPMKRENTALQQENSALQEQNEALEESQEIAEASHGNSIILQNRIHELESSNSELQKKYNELQDNYQVIESNYRDALQELEQLKSEESNYKNAIQELERLKSEIASNSTSSTLVSSSETVASISSSQLEEYHFLDVCKPYKFSYFEERSKLNMMGKAYANGFILTAFSNGYAYFSLEEKYSTLEFDFGLLDGTNMLESKYEIFLDGELHETIEGTPVRVKHITIQLNKASQLLIKPVSDSEKCYYGFADAVIK